MSSDESKRGAPDFLMTRLVDDQVNDDDRGDCDYRPDRESTDLTHGQPPLSHGRRGKARRVAPRVALG